MPDLLHWLHGLPAPLVLLVAGVLITAEAGLLIGIVLPGATALLALGVLARLGVVALPAAVAVAAVAAVAGTQLGYWRGVPARLAGRATERAEGLLRRGGLAGLCMAQWIVGVRTVTPRLAAHAGIRYRRYTTVSAPTALVWAATLVTAAYLASAAYQELAHWLTIGGLGIAAALVAICVLVGVLGR